VSKRSRFNVPILPLLFILLAFVHPAQGQGDTCIRDHGAAAVHHFLRDLQHYVAVDDRMHLVQMVQFPISIRVGEKPLTLQNKEQLLKYYAVAFDPKVKAFIRKQKFSDLFCNWKGIMIGRGEIWINTTGESSRLKIIAINNNPPWTPEDK
jgi:hypothetical protein